MQKVAYLLQRSHTEILLCRLTFQRQCVVYRLFFTVKFMNKNRQCLTKTHNLEQSLISNVRKITEPENYFVGLPDTRIPLPRNILMFCSKGLVSFQHYNSHQRYMLIVNIETAATILLDGLLIRLMPGQALLVFPFQSHRFLIQNVTNITWLYITFELPESPTLENLRNCPIEVPPDILPLLENLVLKYQKALEHQAPCDEITALLFYILIRLLNKSRETSDSKWKPHLPLPAHRIVQKASQYILAHKAENLTIAKIAATLSISEGHLRNCFHRVLGISVTTHIRRTRVYAACSLLSRTESSITEIAYHCGFSSVYTFSRAFKREIKMAPRHYRNHLWQHHNVALTHKQS